uniref:Gustatory receptor n=1 Tax=Anopheles farauti TaxID=69004 RepID=A0A182QZZ3_9DIPT
MSHDVPITKVAFVLIKCRAIALLLVVIYPCGYLGIIKDHNFPLLAISYYLVVLQFTLNYVIVVILYLQVLFDPATLLHLLNDLIDKTNALLQCTYTAMHNTCGTVGRRLLFKIIVSDLLQTLLWFSIFIWFQRKIGPVYVLAFCLNVAASMQLAVVINILIAALLWASFMYRLINEHILTIVGNLLQMEDDAQPTSFASSASSERRFICNHIYRQLGVLRSHHYALTETIQNIVQFYNLPLALIILYQFLIIISEFRVSRWLTIWSHGIAGTLICIYPYVYCNLIPMIPFPKHFLVHHLVWVQCALHYFAILFGYFQLLPSREIISNVLNNLAYLARAINHGQQWQVKRTKKNIFKHAVKIMLIDTGTCVLFAFYFGQFFSTEYLLVDWYWLLNIFAIWQSTVLNNVIIAVLNVCTHFYVMLNCSIRRYIQQHNQATDQFPFADCEVMNIIRHNHHLVTGSVKTIMRLIESFTIELLHQDFKINNFGMYNVDYTLMFSMIATITSYLIMLVQFQLAEI